MCFHLAYVRRHNVSVSLGSGRYNGSSTQDLDDLTIQCQDMNCNYTHRISESEIKEALKRIKSRKAVGTDEIPVEVWRCLGEVGVR